MKSLRPQATPEQQDAKLKQVGELYEKQFLREMVKAMRSTVHDSGFIKPSQAELIFREQLDQEYVEKWGDKGGIGLADLIHQQLLDKFGAQFGIRPPPEKPHGPLKLSEKDDYKVRSLPSGKSSVAVRIDVENAESNKVTSPWSGKYLGKFALDENMDQQHILLEHDNGMKSTLVFSGAARPLKVGDHVEAGQELGAMAVSNPQLLWKIENTK